MQTLSSEKKQPKATDKLRTVSDLLYHTVLQMFLTQELYTFQLFTFQGWKWHYIKQIDNIGSKLLLTIRRHNHKTAAKTSNNYQNSSDELITVGPYLIHKYDVLLLLTSDKLDKHDYMLSDPMTPLPGLQIYSLVWS